jgi:hypothetical protein
LAVFFSAGYVYLAEAVFKVKAIKRKAFAFTDNAPSQFMKEELNNGEMQTFLPPGVTTLSTSGPCAIETLKYQHTALTGIHRSC